MRREKGYTLVELMMVIAILGILGSLMATFYMQVFKSYQKVEAKSKVTQVAITAIGMIQKQLREITQKPTCAANTTLHPTSGTPVSFFIPSLTDPTTRSSDDQIDYYLGTYNGKNIFLQRLVRGVNTYTLPVLFDFDSFRNNPVVIPQGGGVARFMDDSSFRFDDVAFMYDDTYNMINVGITVSVEDKGKKGRRETLTLTTALAIRNTF